MRDNFAVSGGNTLENEMAIQTNDIGELKDLSLDIVNRVEKDYENRRGGNAIGLREGVEIGVVGFGGEELPADDAMVVTGLEGEPVAESAGEVVVRRGLDERLRVQDMERQIKSRRKNLVNLFFNRVRE